MLALRGCKRSSTGKSPANNMNRKGSFTYRAKGKLIIVIHTFRDAPCMIFFFSSNLPAVLRPEMKLGRLICISVEAKKARNKFFWSFLPHHLITSSFVPGAARYPKMRGNVRLHTVDICKICVCGGGGSFAREDSPANSIS